MGVTPNFGFPYPALTDAPDGPSQIQALAEAVETELEALLSGGTASDPTLFVTDTWHSLGTCGSTGCTLEQARYRLTIEGECEIDIALVAGGGGSNAGTYTWTATLPALYRFPGDFLRIYPLPFNAAITTATNDSIIAVDGSDTGSPGRVRITIPAVASGVCFSGTCRIPLS